MNDLSIEQITQWARTVAPGEYRVGKPIPRELVEMARLAFEAGRARGDAAKLRKALIAMEAARLQALPWGIKTPVFVNVDTRLP